MAVMHSNSCGPTEVSLFRSLFSGRTDVFGTYDKRTGAVRQVKAPVTDAVLAAHLAGQQPYGVYLLTGDRTAAAVIDFDDPDLNPVVDCVDHARSYGLPGYIERSKSKGHHVWFFLPRDGVPAWKPRRILAQILAEIDQPTVEIFPKQDRLDVRCRYGNFINAPLFAPLAECGRTVFVPRRAPHHPVADQWDYLAQIERIPEEQLDEIIAANDLVVTAAPAVPVGDAPLDIALGFALPPCAQRMLAEGVQRFQRVACFRLAVQLRRVGVPQDLANTLLRQWSTKNRPDAGKRIITAEEINAQVADAFGKDYRSYGCESEAVRPFCQSNCPVYLTRSRQTASGAVAAPAALSNPEARSVSMSTNPNRPVREFRVRNLRVAIWQNDTTRAGAATVVHSVTVNKRYRDPNDGAWRDSHSFFADDLPRLRLLLDKAYEYLVLRDAAGQTPDESDTPTTT